MLGAGSMSRGTSVRILFISRDLPYPLNNGGRIRVYSLIRHLSSSHDVDLVALDREPESPERIHAMEELCREVIAVPLAPRQRPDAKRREQMLSILRRRPYAHTAHYSPEMQAAIDRQLAANDYDIVQVEYAQMGYYDLGKHPGRVLDQHNVEAEIMERAAQREGWSLRKLFYWREATKFRREEAEICRRFEHCLATSVRDRDILAAAVPTSHFHVVPNGVDCAHFDAAGTEAPSTSDSVLFTGSLAYYPNVDGIHSFMREIFPRIRAAVPTIRFLIVGREPPPAVTAYGAHPNVEVVADVPDMREYYAKAAVVVVPLRVGGGTRLKILEAMAMAKPVVSTSVGAEGIEVTPGTDIALADEPGAFADAVISLLAGEGSAELAAAGRRLVEQRYDWTSIGAELEAVYEQLLCERRPLRNGDESW